MAGFRGTPSPVSASAAAGAWGTARPAVVAGRLGIGVLAVDLPSCMVAAADSAACLAVACSGALAVERNAALRDCPRRTLHPRRSSRWAPVHSDTPVIKSVRVGRGDGNVD